MIGAGINLEDLEGLSLKVLGLIATDLASYY